MHCGTRCFIQAKEVPTLKDEFGFESQPLPKQPFLTKITKINSSSKIKKELGTWQAGMLFRILWRFFFVLYQGTLGRLLMSLKWIQS